jgi:hypothetical protein
MTNEELIKKLQKLPADATVKIIQEDLSGERYFDVNTIENMSRVLVTSSGFETVETIILGI